MRHARATCLSHWRKPLTRPSSTHSSPSQPFQPTLSDASQHRHRVVQMDATFCFGRRHGLHPKITKPWAWDQVHQMTTVQPIFTTPRPLRNTVQGWKSAPLRHPLGPTSTVLLSSSSSDADNCNRGPSSTARTIQPANLLHTSVGAGGLPCPLASSSSLCLPSPMPPKPPMPCPARVPLTHSKHRVHPPPR
jgi:hypothetical protein